MFREADRRGITADAIVEEAVQRFVVGADLHKLLDEFDRQDAADPEALTEEAADLGLDVLPPVRRIEYKKLA